MSESSADFVPVDGLASIATWSIQFGSQAKSNSQALALALPSHSHVSTTECSACLPWCWQPPLHLGDLLQSMTRSPMLVFAVQAKESQCMHDTHISCQDRACATTHALQSQAGTTR